MSPTQCLHVCVLHLCVGAVSPSFLLMVATMWVLITTAQCCSIFPFVASVLWWTTSELLTFPTRSCFHCLCQFVFPDGMRLRRQESPPTMFHFVLTNSCGLKMHGAALQVTEELDPQHLGGMVSKAFSAATVAIGTSSGSRSGIRISSSSGSSRGRGSSSRALLTPAQLPTWLRDTVSTRESVGKRFLSSAS